MRKKRKINKKKLLKRYKAIKRITAFVSVLLVLNIFCFVFIIGPTVLETNAATTTLSMIIHPEGWVEPEPPVIIEEPEEEEEEAPTGGASALQPGMPQAIKSVRAEEGPASPIITELGWGSKPQIIVEGLSEIKAPGRSEVIKIPAGGIGGGSGPIKIKGQRLTGRFRTNIRDALIFVRISSPVIHIATLNGGTDGYVEWTTPELAPGFHTIYIEVRSPYDPTIKASISFSIEILTPEEELAKETAGESLPIEEPSGIKKVPAVPRIILPPGVSLFHLNIEVPVSEIFSGEKIKTQAEIYKISPAGRLIVPVTYTIRDAKGNIIFEGTEQVPVTNKTIILKDFKTSPINGAGIYTITLQLEQENILFITEDTFVIKEKAIVGLPAGMLGLTARQIFDFFRGGILALLIILLVFVGLFIKEYLTVRKFQLTAKGLLKNKLIS